jgi:hypothetical protein
MPFSQAPPSAARSGPSDRQPWSNRVYPVLSDFNIFRITGGCERTEALYSECCRVAGSS